MSGLSFEYRHLVIPYGHALVDAAHFAPNEDELARLGREGWEVLSFTAVPQPKTIGGFVAVYLLRRAAPEAPEADAAVAEPDTETPDESDPRP